MSDRATVEVILTSDGRLWQEKLGGGLEHIGEMSAAQGEAVIRFVSGLHGCETHSRNPWIEAELPGGSRFAGQLPPIVLAPTFAIRKHALEVYTLSEYFDAGIMTAAQRDAIIQAISKGQNILVSGGTGSGKTTLLNAILAEIVRQFPTTRPLILEDTREIQCRAPRAEQYRTSPDVDMTQLLKIALRMRPDRILVGELRGSEALDWCDAAANSGHDGSAVTIHANSAEAALTRIVSLVSRNPHAPRQIEPVVAEAVNVVVQINRIPGGRCVRDVLRVDGWDSSGGWRFTQL